MMLIHISFYVVFLSNEIVLVKGRTNYCNLPSCGDTIEERILHTMCRFPKPYPVIGCQVVNMESFKDIIVDRHNYHRNNVARGRERPQPPASNMMRISWDAELQEIAERWCMQCLYAHDPCRNVPRFSVGQNGAAAGDERIEGLVDAWFSEISNMDPNAVYGFGMGVYSTMNIGHYTQLVWAETRYIGCASTISPCGKHILMCNYGPAGNVQGEDVYKPGAPQSKCPGKKDDKYEGLCNSAIHVAPTNVLLAVTAVAAALRAFSTLCTSASTPTTCAVNSLAHAAPSADWTKKGKNCSSA